MKIKTFRDLRVWEKAHHLVLEIYKITKRFPDDEKFGLISQIRRSAVSVPANIAEGNKKSTKDFLRFLHISQASLEETKYYFILGKDLNYIEENDFNRLNVEANEIGMMLNGLCLKLNHAIT